MAENIDLKIPSSSNHNGNGGGSGSSHGNSHGGNHNNGGYRRNGNDHRDRGHRSGNQSPRRPKSPSTFGKKTNNTPGYSSGPRYPTAGPSYSKPPHHRQEGPSTKKVQLSVKEEEELCAAGKCFKCKEHGHMARNCPTNNSVKSSSSGKPPGLSSFSLGIDLEETERLRDASLPERSGLSLGFVNIGGDSDGDDLEYLDPPEESHPPGSDTLLDLVKDDSEFDDLLELVPVSDSEDESPSYDDESEISDEQSEWSDSGLSAIDEFIEMENRASAEEDAPVPLVLTPSMQFAMYEGHIPHPSVRLAIIEMEAERRGDRWALGSAPSRKLEYLLELTQPYPGDPFNVLQFRGPRFMAHQISKTEVIVSDRVYDTNNILPVDVAISEGFEVADWYAWLHRERSRVTAELSPSTQVTLRAPDVWSWNASLVLQGSAPYPGDVELSGSILDPH